MTKGWKFEPGRHSLASKGVKTTASGCKGKNVVYDVAFTFGETGRKNWGEVYHHPEKGKIVDEYGTKVAEVVSRRLKEEGIRCSGDGDVLEINSGDIEEAYRVLKEDGVWDGIVDYFEDWLKL